MVVPTRLQFRKKHDWPQAIQFVVSQFWCHQILFHLYCVQALTWQGHERRFYLSQHLALDSFSIMGAVRKLPACQGISNTFSSFKVLFGIFFLYNLLKLSNVWTASKSLIPSWLFFHSPVCVYVCVQKLLCFYQKKTKEKLKLSASYVWQKDNFIYFLSRSNLNLHSRSRLRYKINNLLFLNYRFFLQMAPHLYVQNLLFTHLDGCFCTNQENNDLHENVVWYFLLLLISAAYEQVHE